MFLALSNTSLKRLRNKCRVELFFGDWSIKSIRAINVVAMATGLCPANAAM
jgi:hypothetical protein